MLRVVFPVAESILSLTKAASGGQSRRTVAADATTPANVADTTNKM